MTLKEASDTLNGFADLFYAIGVLYPDELTQFEEAIKVVSLCADHYSDTKEMGI